MKNLLLVLLCITIASCGEKINEQTVSNAQYLEQLMKEYNLPLDKINELKSDPQFKLYLQENTTKEEIKQMVENIANMHHGLAEETAFWDKMKANGKLEAYGEAFKNAETEEEMEMLKEKFPEISKRLEANTFHMSDLQQIEK